MRIRCERSKLSTEQVAIIPAGSDATQALWRSQFDVEVGTEYDALGMYLHRGTLWVYIVDSFNRLRVAPLGLFAVIDGSIPTTWKVSGERSMSVIFVAPAEASSLSFADRVDEQEPTAVDSFNKILAQVKRSAPDSGSP